MFIAEIIMMNSNTIEQAKHNGETNGSEIGYRNHSTETFMVGSPVPSIHSYYRRIQAISTGIFMALLILIVILVVIYRSKYSIETVNYVTIMNPTLEAYNSLLEVYPQTLDCSCSNIAIPYGQFLTINHVSHPVCSSMYITDTWIDYLSIPSLMGTFDADDFRVQAPKFFQALQSLCGLADQYLQTNLPRHLSKEYISMSIASPQMVSYRMSMFFQALIQSIMSDFLLSLQIIRGTTQANALLSGSMTNYFLYLPSGSIYVRTMSRQFTSNCMCSRTSACVANAVVYLGSSSSIWNVPGFFYGCYILESLFQSDLRCLFDPSCLNQLNNYLQNYPVMNVSALNPATLDSFTSTDSVGDIVARLFVDRWDYQLSYRDYYAACQPKTCTYPMADRKEEKVHMVTTVLATIGGIAAILNIFIFVSTTIMFECMQRKARNSVTAIKPPVPSYTQY